MSGPRRENVEVADRARQRPKDLIHERPREDWHGLLDELTKVRGGDDVTIEHPTSIRTDSRPPKLPFVIQVVGADGSETLVTVLPRS